MIRAARFVAYALAAASLAACSASPTGPAPLKCNPATPGSACENTDFVNPHVDFVNPHVDFVNPHIDFVNPHV
jgi:hypothetical protein